MASESAAAQQQQQHGLTRRSALMRLGGGAAAVAVMSTVPAAVWAGPAAAADAGGPGPWPVTVKNGGSGQLLNVFGGSGSDGAQIIQWPAGGGANENWRIVVQADGWATIASYASGKLLDLAGGAAADGTRVVQMTANGSTSQQWKVVDAGNGGVRIVNRASGTVLSVTGGSTDNGANVEIRRDSSGADQRWVLTAPPGAGQPYRLDSTALEPRSDDPVPGFGGAAGGVGYAVTRTGWYRGDKPWFPVSGEFHYVRCPEGSWDRELGKLRAAGVGIVATYVFWNHHEQPEGTWDWSGRRDLRSFVNAAQRQGLQLWLRVGPFVNAETDHGGLPSFALSGARSNDPGYLAKVGRYFDQVAAQLTGLWAKDGGPILGIQLENEFASGDPAHITTLKQMCHARGMDAPFYTVTANTDFDKDVAIPLQGSYCYRGWAHAGGTDPVSGFIYGTDEWSANTDIGHTYYDTLDYPRGYCEMGTGSPMRGTDRFLVEPKYTVGQAYDAVGRGSNYIGYYMFHGGTQIAGLSDSWPLTYDFQAPLGEFGQVRDSFHEYRRLHTFLNTCAEELVPARTSRDAYQVLDPTQTWRLRYIGRFAPNGRGFVFVNNTQLNVDMVPQPDVQIQVDTPEGTVSFPSEPLTMPTGRSNFFPFMTDLNGADLRWATVQPLAKVAGDDVPTWVYWAPDWTDRALAFGRDVALVDELGRSQQRIVGDELIATVPADARTSILVHRRTAQGKAKGPALARVLVLTEEDSLNAAVVPLDGRDRLVIISGGQVSGLSPQVRIAGAAGDRVVVDILSTHDQAHGGTWRRVPAAHPFVRYTHTLAPGGPAPTVTAMGDGQWHIHSDPTSRTGLAGALMALDYHGNDATLVVDGTTITQDLYHGAAWTVDLNRADLAEASDFVIRITDWDDDIAGVPKPTGAMPDLVRSTWQPIREVTWPSGSGR